MSVQMTLTNQVTKVSGNIGAHAGLELEVCATNFAAFVINFDRPDRTARRVRHAAFVINYDRLFADERLGLHGRGSRGGHTNVRATFFRLQTAYSDNTGWQRISPWA